MRGSGKHYSAEELATHAVDNCQEVMDYHFKPTEQGRAFEQQLIRCVILAIKTALKQERKRRGRNGRAK